MADIEYKYTDLMVLQGLLEVQTSYLKEQIKVEEDEDKSKFLKSELTKMNGLKTKTKKQIANY